MYAFHMFIIVVSQASLYFMYMSPGWHRWINEHLFVMPRWISKMVRGHIEASKTLLLVVVILETALLVLSCLLFTYCDDVFAERDGHDGFDEDFDGDSDLEEAESLIGGRDDAYDDDDDDDDYNDDLMVRQSNVQYSQRHSDLFNKYGLTNDPKESDSPANYRVRTNSRRTSNHRRRDSYLSRNNMSLNQ
jgi:hypothetical protein